jgi:reverse gyrase
MRERLQLYMIACIFHDDVVAILLHSNEIKKIDALLSMLGRSQ